MNAAAGDDMTVSAAAAVGATVPVVDVRLLVLRTAADRSWDDAPEKAVTLEQKELDKASTKAALSIPQHARWRWRRVWCVVRFCQICGATGGAPRKQ